MSPDAPDFYDLATLLVRKHCMAFDEATGMGEVNVDTLADDLASRLEAGSIVLRAIMATILLPDNLLERSIAAIVAAEKQP